MLQNSQSLLKWSFCCFALGVNLDFHLKSFIASKTERNFFQNEFPSKKISPV